MVHSWNIIDLERNITSGVVNRIEFIVETEHNNVSHRHMGYVEVTGSADGPNFIEYENLTSEEVIGWVKNSVDVSDIEATQISTVHAMIDDDIPPTTLSGMPWGN
jgi:hypothetical protein|tara:strand:+ start:163 stop:477 length:315 start_codon:yes stop_codon:yes gene_type:complete